MNGAEGRAARAPGTHRACLILFATGYADTDADRHVRGDARWLLKRVQLAALAKRCWRDG